MHIVVPSLHIACNAVHFCGLYNGAGVIVPDEIVRFAVPVAYLKPHKGPVGQPYSTASFWQKRDTNATRLRLGWGE
jgi:hypothetical protein